MTDHDALLAAVIAEPGDDTVRLAYADWIEEHGGQPERAEFIRVQCELARVYPDGDKFTSKNPQAAESGWDRYKDLRRRERELQIVACPAWRKEQFGPELAEEMNAPLLGGMLMPGAINCFYSRGFVSALTCTWDAWRTHAAAIRAAQPVERCKWTTHPRWAMPDGTVYYGENALPFAQAEWPGIAFELPAERGIDTTRITGTHPPTAYRAATLR